MRTSQQEEVSKRILDMSLDVFYEHGYEGATIRMIAARVGLNSASLYYYFPSKNEILREILLQAMRGLLGAAEEAIMAAGDDPLRRLEAMLRTHVEFHGVRRREALVGEFELRCLPPEHRQEVIELRDRYERLMHNILTEGIAIGRFRPVEPDLVVRALIWSCASVVQWFQPDGPIHLADIADYYTRLWTTGLLNSDLPSILLTPSRSR